MKLRTKKLKTKSRIEELEEENRKMSLKIQTLETENQALKQENSNLKSKQIQTKLSLNSGDFAFESESKSIEIKREIKPEESEDIIMENEDENSIDIKEEFNAEEIELF